MQLAVERPEPGGEGVEAVEGEGRGVGGDAGHLVVEGLVEVVPGLERALDAARGGGVGHGRSSSGVVDAWGQSVQVPAGPSVRPRISMPSSPATIGP